MIRKSVPLSKLIRGNAPTAVEQTVASLKALAASVFRLKPVDFVRCNQASYDILSRAADLDRKEKSRDTHKQQVRDMFMGLPVVIIGSKADNDMLAAGKQPLTLE